MRISDWSSDVCSSDLVFEQLQRAVRGGGAEIGVARVGEQRHALLHDEGVEIARVARIFVGGGLHEIGLAGAALELFGLREQFLGRTGEDGLAVPHQTGLAEQIGVDVTEHCTSSEEHTSALQSLK